MLKSFKNLEQGILFSGAAKRKVSLMRACEEIQEHDDDNIAGFAVDSPTSTLNRSFRDVHGRMGDVAFNPSPKGKKVLDLSKKLTEEANANSFIRLRCKTRNHPDKGFEPVKEIYKDAYDATESTLDQLKRWFLNNHSNYCTISSKF